MMRGKSASGLALVCLFLGVTMLVSRPVTLHAATGCERVSQAPYVSLSIDPGRTNYITTRSKADLRKLHAGRRINGGDWRPIGLTLAELGLSLAVSVRAEKMSDGQFCSQLAAVEATIGYGGFDVYIASEFQRGSCQYTSILDHERQHVVIFQDTLNQYFARFERTLRNAANSAQPVLTRKPNLATDHFLSELERSVKPLFREFNREKDIKNSALDTPENYAREQDNCVTW